MTTLKYWQGINRAMTEEMEADNSVIVFGEDVATAGGTYLATKGLLDRFGPARVRDTPISEGMLLGMATGAAMTGLRPVVEVMFFDFVTLAMDQLVNHAAKVSSISGGEFHVPLVLRTMSGAGKNAGPQHSQNFEAWLAHVPGLKVVAPSNPADALGLLKAAIRDDNPVIVIESLLQWGTRCEAPPQGHVVALGEAAIPRAGDDVTIVVWGGTVPRALSAADTLESRFGISAEVLDLRTLSPLDEASILRSLGKTGRMLVLHDAVGPFGPGAEVAAIAASAGFASLRAPVVRLAAPFTLVPFPTELESKYYPQSDDVVTAIRGMVER